MKRKLSIYRMTLCALFTAMMCVLGPVSVPIGPVPVALTNLVIYLAAYLLGAQGAVISCAVYLLLGLCGLPVFTQYQGGLDKVVGPTGGYMVGYLFVALIGGLTIERGSRRAWPAFLGLIAGTAALYAFGTAWFLYLTDTGVWAALTLCVFPFIAFDLTKIVFTVVVGRAIYAGLTKANLLRLKY